LTLSGTCSRCEVL